MPLEIILSPGCDITENEAGIRFRGTAHHIKEFASDLRSISALPPGDFAILGTWRLMLSNESSASQQVVAMPAAAWNVCASKFMEVATGREESPFDFGSCGFLLPPPTTDIRVELVGKTMEDKVL